MRKTFSVSVLSGKGGVGKTNLALNLAFCLHKGGHPLLLMDCDMGLANLDVLLGLTPEHTMYDLLETSIAPQEIVVPIEQGGFDFMPAASGLTDLIEMDNDTREILFQRLMPLFSSYDYLFMDLGAGISSTVLSLGAMADMRLVIITPEPTSLTDSYALIKMLHSQYSIEDFHVVVNQAESPAETKQAFQRLAAACDKFLGFHPKFLGGVSYDKALPEAVRRQTPLMRMNHNSPAAKDIFSIAVKVQRHRASVMETLSDTPLLEEMHKKEY
ncbi:MinD/ParA family protein [Oleidesulfovibrio sp.]|uniref:MinD/ParA family protein n=1 Tax=Oleidesulfovibrio sp. TaxID=2909707 RepID=UPI003A87FB37